MSAAPIRYPPGVIYRETVRLLARIGFWCAMLVAYVAAVIPSAPSLGEGDKFDHMAAFALLAVLGRLGWSRRRAIWIGLALVGFGALIELSQASSFVGRDASWYDLLADLVAVLLGLAAGQLLLLAIRRAFPRAPTEQDGGDIAPIVR